MLLRYFAREILISSLLVLAALLALFGFFDLIRELDDLGRGTYRLNAMLGYVALTLPSHAYVLLPAAGLIGTLFALARMSISTRHEIENALRFCVTRASLIGPVALVSASRR